MKHNTLQTIQFLSVFYSRFLKIELVLPNNLVFHNWNVLEKESRKLIKTEWSAKYYASCLNENMLPKHTYTE